MFPTPLVGILVVTTLLLQFCTCQDPAVTCQGENPLFPATGAALKLCIFKETDNVVTNLAGIGGNLFLYSQANVAFVAGKCYCKQDCNPSQIVCENPGLMNAILPPGLNINILNGVIEIEYLLANWYVHCYCPSLVQQGVDPCLRPPKPEFCQP